MSEETTNKPSSGRCVHCGHRDRSHTFAAAVQRGDRCLVSQDGQATGPGLEHRTPCSCPGYTPPWDPPVDEPAPHRSAQSSDFPTNEDRVCANAIAQALMDRYGHVPLSVRYQAARMAMNMADVGAQGQEDRFRRWLAEGEPAGPKLHGE